MVRFLQANPLWDLRFKVSPRRASRQLRANVFDNPYSGFGDFVFGGLSKKTPNFGNNSL